MRWDAKPSAEQRDRLVTASSRLGVRWMDDKFSAMYACMPPMIE